jgi:hypothetical protein
MRRVQTAAMDGVATEDTVETGTSLTNLHISEMWVEDSEELYFYWMKLKTYQQGGSNNESLVDSLSRLEKIEQDAKAKNMNDKNSLLERYHHAIKPWNLTEMSHEMRCHLYKIWQDIENHKQLEWFCAAEEPEYIDHEEIDSYCYLHRPTFRKEGWQTEPPKQM